MRDWPEFVSHKVVKAAPIVQISQRAGELDIWVKPFDDHTMERFVPTEPAMIARAEVGGYAIIYPDGFKSVSPKAAFEAGYKRTNQLAADASRA